MFPLDLLQELLSPGTAVFSIVFGPLEQQCQQEAASTKLVSPAQPQVLVSAAVSLQTDGHEDQLGSRPVSDLLVSSNQWHCLPCVRPWLAGWRLSASPSWSHPSPTLFPEEDPAVSDQYLTGETMTVKAEGGHQRAAAPARALQEAAAGPLLPGAGHHDLAVWTG